MEIVLAIQSRREMCGECPNVHRFPLDNSDEVVILCKEKYRSSCSMKSALKTKSSTCPRIDGDWAIRWSMAKLDEMAGCCGGQQTTGDAPDYARNQTVIPKQPQRGIAREHRVYQ